MDVGVFHETKMTDGIYTKGSAVYKVVATSAPIRHCGCVALFYRKSPVFAFEAIRQFGANVVKFQVATG